MSETRDIVASLRLYLRQDSRLYNNYGESISEAVDQIESLRATVAGLEKALRDIAKQRTVSEWEQFAKDEGLDPDGADYSGGYDAAVRTARTALGGEAGKQGKGD